MGWSPEGRVDNGQKGQRGAVSNQILPAPGDEQRLGVYQMDGMRDVSVNSLPIDLIIHCWQVQLKQLFKVIFLLCLFLINCNNHNVYLKRFTGFNKLKKYWSGF